jgi:hypothetical protein
MDIKETAFAYTLAVSSSILGSVGLRKLLLRLNLPGMLGTGLLALTPYLGLVTASSVNLFFARSKDLTDGIYVIDPETNEKIETVKSKQCGLLAFKDSLLIRWLLPIPSKPHIIPNKILTS